MSVLLSKNAELYALNYFKILNLEQKYFTYHSNKDNFDYTSDFYNIGVEITLSMTEQQEKVIRYIGAYRKNDKKELDKKGFKFPIFDGNRLIAYAEDTFYNIKAILKSLSAKNAKLKRRISNKFNKYLLIIFCNDGGLINEPSYFDSFIYENVFTYNQFDTVLIICLDAFFVLDKTGKIIKWDLLIKKTNFYIN